MRPRTYSSPFLAGLTVRRRRRHLRPLHPDPDVGRNFHGHDLIAELGDPANQAASGDDFVIFLKARAFWYAQRLSGSAAE